MASIKAYIFESEQEAKDLIAQIDFIKGYPTVDGSTITYCNHEALEGVVFIRHTNFIENFVGFPPIDFDVKEETFV